MRCVITYTRTGAEEPFDGAEWVVSDLEAGDVQLSKLMTVLEKPFDDRRANPLDSFCQENASEAECVVYSD